MAGEFETKDDGTRQFYDSGMMREPQNNKPRFDLIIPKDQPYNETLLYRWAMLMARGAEKYSERNWEKACSQEEYDRFKASALRHCMQVFSEENDEDHFAAVCFNLCAAVYTKGRMDKNEK